MGDEDAAEGIQFQQTHPGGQHGRSVPRSRVDHPPLAVDADQNGVRLPDVEKEEPYVVLPGRCDGEIVL